MANSSSMVNWPWGQDYPMPANFEAWSGLVACTSRQECSDLSTLHGGDAAARAVACTTFNGGLPEEALGQSYCTCRIVQGLYGKTCALRTPPTAAASAAAQTITVLGISFSLLFVVRVFIALRWFGMAKFKLFRRVSLFCAFGTLFSAFPFYIISRSTMADKSDLYIAVALGALGVALCYLQASYLCLMLVFRAAWYAVQNKATYSKDITVALVFFTAIQLSVSLAVVLPTSPVYLDARIYLLNAMIGCVLVSVFFVMEARVLTKILREMILFSETVHRSPTSAGIKMRKLLKTVRGFMRALLFLVIMTTCSLVAQISIAQDTQTNTGKRNPLIGVQKSLTSALAFSAFALPVHFVLTTYYTKIEVRESSVLSHLRKITIGNEKVTPDPQVPSSIANSSTSPNDAGTDID